jgi:hypothetical protein
MIAVYVDYKKFWEMGGGKRGRRKRRCGSVVVEALCYKLYVAGPSAAQGAGIYSASDRNEYQKQKSNVSGE